MSRTFSFSTLRDLKQLSSHSVIYGIAGVSSSAMGMLLIPLYGHVFTPQEFGELQLVQLWLSIASTVAGLGLTQAYFKAYHQFPTEEGRGQTLLLVLCLSILGAAGVGLLFIALSLQTFTSHFELLHDPMFLVLVLGSLITSVLYRLPFQVLRAQQRPVTHLQLGLLGLIVAVALNVVFVWGFSGKVKAVLTAQVLSTLMVLGFAVPLFLKNIRLSFGDSRMKELLKFGMPFVPAAIALWVLEGSDRMILDRFWGPSEVGVYSLGYKFATLLQFPILAFQAAWAPYLLSIAGRENAPQMISRLITYLGTMTMMLAVLVYVLRIPVLSLVATPEFSGAELVVGPVLLGFIFYGFYFIAISGSYIHGKSGVLALLVGVAALLNMGLNILIIPTYGGVGAAWTTAVSYLFLAGMMYRFSHKHFPMPIEWQPLTGVVTCCVVVAWFCDHLVLQGWEAWVIPIALVGIIPCVLWFSGFVIPSERQQIRTYVRNFREAQSSL